MLNGFRSVHVFVRILQTVLPEPGHTTMIAVIHTGLVVYIAVERKKKTTKLLLLFLNTHWYRIGTRVSAHTQSPGVRGCIGKEKMVWEHLYFCWIN